MVFSYTYVLQFPPSLLPLLILFHFPLSLYSFKYGCMCVWTYVYNGSSWRPETLRIFLPSTSGHQQVQSCASLVLVIIPDIDRECSNKPCSEDSTHSILCHAHFLHPFPHFLKCQLNPGGGGRAAPFMVEHSGVSYSQHFAVPAIYNITCNFCVQNSCTLVGVRVQIFTWKGGKCQTMFSIVTDG